jgi:hypothetical protein
MQQKFKILSYWYAFRISITSIKDKECEKFFRLENKLKTTRTNIFLEKETLKELKEMEINFAIDYVTQCCDRSHHMIWCNVLLKRWSYPLLWKKLKYYLKYTIMWYLNFGFNLSSVGNVRYMLLNWFMCTKFL